MKSAERQTQGHARYACKDGTNTAISLNIYHSEVIKARWSDVQPRAHTEADTMINWLYSTYLAKWTRLSQICQTGNDWVRWASLHATIGNTCPVEEDRRQRGGLMNCFPTAVSTLYAPVSHLSVHMMVNNATAN